ncbi:hypothetical protein HYH03_006485 [Edaphochlamys debaryana]|uniref:Uncharacterized protein n=1 Tax=Edaphochlamys debaryana TaxID=47281 RepID=A0A835Y2Z1_9CHLO|nr:hypothetical protein HYH03_006485 [Edaphochlamys debaryana]|eukprot:KAG2495542.1 hypothetical protein HYH03_006485 [Edaphochlamys debaryana]
MSTWASRGPTADGAEAAGPGVYSSRPWTASFGGLAETPANPLDDLFAEASGLLPMPAPMAPSSTEVTRALQHRRQLEEERRRRETAEVGMTTVPDPALDSPVQGSQADDVASAALSGALSDNSSPSRSGTLTGDGGCDGGSDGTAERQAGGGCLVLPQLESLLEIRERRKAAIVVAPAPPQTPSQGQPRKSSSFRSPRAAAGRSVSFSLAAPAATRAPASTASAVPPSGSSFATSRCSTAASPMRPAIAVPPPSHADPSPVTRQELMAAVSAAAARTSSAGSGAAGGSHSLIMLQPHVSLEQFPGTWRASRPHWQPAGDASPVTATAAAPAAAPAPHASSQEPPGLVVTGFAAPTVVSKVPSPPAHPHLVSQLSVLYAPLAAPPTPAAAASAAAAAFAASPPSASWDKYAPPAVIAPPADNVGGSSVAPPPSAASAALTPAPASAITACPDTQAAATAPGFARAAAAEPPAETPPPAAVPPAADALHSELESFRQRAALIRGSSKSFTCGRSYGSSAAPYGTPPPGLQPLLGPGSALWSPGIVGGAEAGLGPWETEAEPGAMSLEKQRRLLAQWGEWRREGRDLGVEGNEVDEDDDEWDLAWARQDLERAQRAHEHKQQAAAQGGGDRTASLRRARSMRSLGPSQAPAPGPLAQGSALAAAQTLAVSRLGGAGGSVSGGAGIGLNGGGGISGGQGVSLSGGSFSGGVGGGAMSPMASRRVGGAGRDSRSGREALPFAFEVRSRTGTGAGDEPPAPPPQAATAGEGGGSGKGEAVRPNIGPLAAPLWMQPPQPTQISGGGAGGSTADGGLWTASAPAAAGRAGSGAAALAPTPTQAKLTSFGAKFRAFANRPVSMSTGQLILPTDAAFLAELGGAVPSPTDTAAFTPSPNSAGGEAARPGPAPAPASASPTTASDRVSPESLSGLFRLRMYPGRTPGAAGSADGRPTTAWRGTALGGQTAAVQVPGAGTSLAAPPHWPSSRLGPQPPPGSSPAQRPRTGGRGSLELPARAPPAAGLASARASLDLGAGPHSAASGLALVPQPRSSFDAARPSGLSAFGFGSGSGSGSFTGGLSPLTAALPGPGAPESPRRSLRVHNSVERRRLGDPRNEPAQGLLRPAGME